jgi:hypothetical protein
MAARGQGDHVGNSSSAADKSSASVPAAPDVAVGAPLPAGPDSPSPNAATEAPAGPREDKSSEVVANNEAGDNAAPREDKSSEVASVKESDAPAPDTSAVPDSKK